MSFELPSGSRIKKIAAWESVIASVLLFFIVVYKFSQIYYNTQLGASVLPNGINKFIVGVMGENEMAHAILYLVIFTLVFSSAIMGYFYDDNK